LPTPASRPEGKQMVASANAIGVCEPLLKRLVHLVKRGDAKLVYE
jgi:hypothetical protein